MGTAHGMKCSSRCCGRRSGVFFLIIPVIMATAICGGAQQTVLQFDPAKTTIKFTLDAALHTVHGTFQAKQSALQFDPTSGKLSGEISVDAKSGQTGNGMRDRKMHRDVLESEQYPEITFRPSRIEGTVASEGKSSVTVYGIFRIHGVNHEIAVPAEVEMNADQWTAMVHFPVPYVKWGMKNPSTLFLRVSESVEVELVASGTGVRPSASSGQ